MATILKHEFSVGDTVRLSDEYLIKHKMVDTTMSLKLGVVLTANRVDNYIMVWVGWKLSGEGFMVFDNRPSPLTVVKE